MRSVGRWKLGRDGLPKGIGIVLMELNGWVCGGGTFNGRRWEEIILLSS